MNQGPLIFLGLFTATAVAWFGMVVTPLIQLRDQSPTPIPPTNERYPMARPGMAQLGREVYRANGCQYCHTQQVRPQGFGADYERGWGKRFSVARDYLFERPVMLGTLRIGPDLMNMAARQTNEIWHFLHLYDPRITVKGSTMPRYPYLFTKRQTSNQLSSGGIILPAESADGAGFEIFPSREARALVSYLQSLKADAPLLEAPLPAPENPPGATEGDTNAVAGSGATNTVSTNAPSQTNTVTKTNAATPPPPPPSLPTR